MASVPCSISSVSNSQPEKLHDNVTSGNGKELDATHISELVAYLGAVPQSINIPHDFVREDTEEEIYNHTAPFVIDDGLLSRLVERTGGSSVSCLVSVFAVTLHLFAALQEDFPIAVYLDACPLLVLRTKFQHVVDMEVLHGTVRDDLEFLTQRQAVPLDDLVKVLGIPSKDLFRASFMLQGSHEDESLLTHSELACLVKPNSNESLIGSFIYDSSILAHDTVLSFSTAFTTILSAWAGEPTPNLDAVTFTDSPTHFPSQPRLDVPDVSFGEFILACAKGNEDRHAVYDDTSCTSYTYQELFSRARCIQNLVRPYRRPSGAVLLLLDRTVDFIAAEIGVNLAGMVFIPCDIGQPAARIRNIIHDAGPVCIVAHRNVLHRLGVGEEIGVPLLLVDTAFDSLETSSAVETSADEPGETAYMIYTSGSTGKPKGVVIGHASVIAFVRNIAGWVQSGTALNSIVTANIAWDTSIYHTYPALVTGGCVKIPKIDGDKDGEYLSTLMRASPVVNMYGSFFPPGMFHVCLGGDEVPPRFVEQVFAELTECPNAEVCHIYGPTEGTMFGSYGVLTRSSLGQLKRRRRVPLERFMPHVAMTVANAAGNELPRGFVGEIIIWGPSLLLEYHNLPEVNAQRILTKDGVRGWRSGDLGRRLPSGELEILGRMDSMRKVKGGFRVELQEIEAHVQSFAEVDKCHISTTQAGGSSAEQQIVAHIVFKEGRRELEKVKEWREMLVEYHKLRADDSVTKEEVSLSFDYRGWNSALGRRNFTHEEMTEWIDAVVARIMETGCFNSSTRKPRVLELGCGTGMILFRLAEMCEKYTAIDFLPSAVAQVQAHARTLGLENVDVHVAAAHQFADVVGTGDLFDLIVCNSVVTYFPSLDYLTTVINQAGAFLAPGGALFLGDIRNAALTSQFAAARAISYENARSVPELAQAMKVFERAEEELLVDPEWFVRFVGDSTVFESTSSMVKRGNSVTDMTLFRYDVVMRSATPLHMQAPNVHVAPAHDDVIAQVRASPAPTLLQNIGNKRISEYHYLSGTHFEPSLPLGEVLHDAKRYAEGSGHHPEALVTQASAIENVMVVPLCSMTRPECFDLLVLNRDTPPNQLNRLIYEAHLRSSTHNMAQDQGTTPRGKASCRTLALLHEHLLQRVPAYVSQAQGLLAPQLLTSDPTQMVPSFVIPVSSLPLTSSHKVDKAKLPEPCPDDRFVPTGKSVQQWDTEDEAHRPIVEAILRVFSEVLFVDKPLSPKDNFFFCGGHSLVAAQATSLIRRELSAELPFTAIIANPTASQLAIQIDSLQKKTGETARVPNILPLNWSPNLRPKAIMFIFPLVGGDLDKMPEFINKIDDGTLGIALYGIVWEPNQHLNTLEKITQSYANSIASIAGSTPTFLIGWCYGGTLATYVAQRLPKATTKVILLNSPSIRVMAGTGAMSKESQDELSHAVTTIDYVWDVAALQYTAYEASQRRFDSVSINAREKASKELIEANIDRHDFAQLIQFIRARFHFPEWVTDTWLSRYLLPLADNYDVIRDIEENYSFLPSDIASMEDQVVLNLVCKKPYAGLPFGLGWSRYEVIGSDEWNYGYSPEIFDVLRVTLLCIPMERWDAVVFNTTQKSEPCGKTVAEAKIDRLKEIITATLQSLWHVLDQGMDAQSAINAPRLHEQIVPLTTTFQYTYHNATIAYMAALGHNVTWVAPGQSVVQGISRGTNGVFVAASDPRKLDSGSTVY